MRTSYTISIRPGYYSTTVRLSQSYNLQHWFLETDTRVDINPQYHPTDVGHVKLASHLLQYIKMNFNFVFGATGPEVQHDTLYWNDQQDY